MYILAIETTGPYGSAAIMDGEGRVLSHKVCTKALSHLKELMPMIGQAVSEAGISKQQIDLLAVSAGPGSFTGIRIGVSTARALAQALGIKAVAVPTLDAFLMGSDFACRKAGAESPLYGCAIINARRGQVYGMVEDFLPAGPYMLDEVLQIIKEKVFAGGGQVFFMGDGADAYSKQIEAQLAGYEDRYHVADEACRYQDAAAAGRWALAAIEREGFENIAADYDSIMPEYMRKAEAEQKLEAGQLPICKGPKQE